MDQIILTADRLAPGRAGRIVCLPDVGPLSKRLTELGLIPGAVLLRRYTAPGGSPIAFEIQGALLSLRSKDAARIIVQEDDGLWTA